MRNSQNDNDVPHFADMVWLHGAAFYEMTIITNQLNHCESTKS